ncbi:gamma-glutamyltranspeptidase, partial [Thozetella sp. PMI_491]
YVLSQRTVLGDPAFVSKMDAYHDHMVDDATAIEIRSKSSDDHTLPVDEYNPDRLEVLSTPGASHLVVSDNQGMVVSMTIIVNTEFAPQVLVPKTGVILNNEMNDFSIPGTTNAFGFKPSPNNFIRSGIRPLSSKSPDIELCLVLGGQEGSRIISAMTQVLWYILDRGMNCSSGLNTPRLHDPLQPNQVMFSWTYDNSTVEVVA